MDLFLTVKVQHLATTSSDHLPILVKLFPDQVFTSARRFKFENVWLRVNDCDQVVKESWLRSEGQQLQTHLLRCGEDLQRWGERIQASFGERLRALKNIISILRRQFDDVTTMELTNMETQYFDLLKQKEMFWQQRSKVFWLREGDANTKTFHAYVSARHR